MTDESNSSEIKWTPTEWDLDMIAQLESSDDLLDNAYAAAYKERCYVVEIGTDDQGLAAVVELDRVVRTEHELGIEIDLNKIGLDGLIKLGARPGRGPTRHERVLDGVRRVKESRQDQDI